PVLVTLLQLALAATTATETIGFLVGAAWGNTRSRRLFLLFERRAMLRMLAITTLVVIGTGFLRTTRLFLLALGGGRIDDRLYIHSCNDRSCRRVSSRRVSLGGFSFRLLAHLFFGTTGSGFLLGFQASGLFSGTL